MKDVVNYFMDSLPIHSLPCYMEVSEVPQLVPCFPGSAAHATRRETGQKVRCFKSNKIRRVCQLISKPRKDQTASVEENWVLQLVASAVANSRPKGKQDERKFMSKLLK